MTLTSGGFSAQAIWQTPLSLFLRASLDIISNSTDEMLLLFSEYACPADIPI